jgi:putative Holliday junction resolvase
MSATGRRRRLLAVDFGDRRTGLAATDATGTIAVPLPPLATGGDEACATAVAALAAERNSEAIVVGMPLLVDGSSGGRARRTLRFVEVLRRLAPCPVTTIDEAGTTAEAHERLGTAGIKAARRKQLADSIAALLILERYRAEAAD